MGIFNQTFIPISLPKCTLSDSLLLRFRNGIISLFRVILPVALQIVLSILLVSKLFAIKRNLNPNGEMKREYKFAKTRAERT